MAKIDLRHGRRRARSRPEARRADGDRPGREGRSTSSTTSADTVSKVRAGDMRVLQTVSGMLHPIGITYDAPTRTVWVACYSGSIIVFRDG